MTARPSGIPLRPDYGAYQRQARDDAMRSLTRACLAAAIGADSTHEYAADIVKSRWPDDRAAICASFVIVLATR